MFSRPAGVFRHAQVVEHAAGIAVEAAHGGGDAAVAVCADDADGEAAQAGGVLGAVAGSDAQAVLVEGVVEDVVDGLDLPVAAVQFEQAPGVGGIGVWPVMARAYSTEVLPDFLAVAVRSTRKAWPTCGKVR